MSWSADNQNDLICKICRDSIIGKYISDRWNQAICKHHFDNNEVFYCDSCWNLTLFDERRMLGHRPLCRACCQSVVQSKADIKQSLRNVQSVLRKIGLYPITDQNRSIEIVRPDYFVSKCGDENVKGQALMTRKSRLGRVTFDHTILMAPFLTRLEFDGVLAHEIGHTWLAEKKKELKLRLEEGFCNLCSYEIYYQHNSTHGQVLIENLETDTDPIYGDGFRAMRDDLYEMGWSEFLNNLKTK